MKVALIYPCQRSDETASTMIMPPLAIYALAGILRDAGHDVVCLDPKEAGVKVYTDDGLGAYLDGVDIFGISCNSFNWAEGRVLAHAAKRISPETTVVVGGVHANYFGQHMMEIAPIDYIIRGEGEFTFPKLLSALGEGKQPDGIPGVMRRMDDGTIATSPPAPNIPIHDLEWMPHPAYASMPATAYTIIPVETSRGCYNNCFFCSIPHRTTWRGYKASVAVDRLRNALAVHPANGKIRQIYLVDDCFTAEPDHVAAFSEEAQRQGVTCSYIIEARVPDLLKETNLKALQPLSVSEIQMGVECGYDEGLRQVGKRTTIAEVQECARRLEEHDLIKPSMFSFILGLPWEGERECMRTLDFAAELLATHGGTANFAWWLPLPSIGRKRWPKYGIDISEDVYDEVGWHLNRSFFQRTHPGLTPEALYRIKTAAREYMDDGIPLTLHGV